ncbi:MAG: 4-alpha-glucanotransferase [Acidobacteriota bacterium]
MSGRHAGINVPLFSIRSSESWGIGEIPDLLPLVAWLHDAGCSRLMVLPLGTMPSGMTSPYSAISTLSIDPIFISLAGVSDFARAGGTPALSVDAQAAIGSARQSPMVDYDAVRRAKDEAHALAFAAFLKEEWEQLTPRASSLAAYVARERWWLDDYALYLAIAASRAEPSWRAWPAPLRDREPRALDEARRQLSREVLLHQYLQWVAEGQWQTARVEAHRRGVALVGDLPFVAGANSPEVWARVDEFRLDVSAGVPPDAFSPTGQDWGLPMYKWDTIRGTGYAWMRQRGRRMAGLYDILRVDHVIGLYRTFGRPALGDPFFSPADEPDQIAQGEAVMRALSESGLSLIAEDLGVVPDFLRPSLARLHMPGCKVMRWERDWHAEGAPYLNPADYPPLSAAMTGTHDTEPLAVWWDNLPEADRAAVLAIPSMAARGLSPDEGWCPAIRDALIDLAAESASDEVIFPIQDLFGWPARVNAPGTVTSHNWTWCLPFPIDGLQRRPDGQERAAFLRALLARAGRLTPGR